MRIRTLALAGAALLAVVSLLPAQEDPSPRRGGRFGGRFGGRGNREKRAQDDEAGVKPYDDVITEKAVTQKGLFLVHRLEDKLFYEIPPSELGHDMLWVTEIEKTQAGFGYGGTGVGSRVVRWELRDEKVLLRDVKYAIRTDDTLDSLANSVEATSLLPIIMAFPVKAWGKDKAPVIEVTNLVTDDVKEFSAARRLNASGVDSSRTFIDRVKAFPRNIETKVLMTYRLSSQSRTTTSPFPRRQRGPRRDSTQSGVTVLVHHSMVLLPDEPMRPRLFDDRVGFFTVGFENYDVGEHQVKTVRYVSRWRLDKKDPEAEVSDPVKPIVFYVGRGVPDKWRDAVKRGIEMWQPAFEAAGFSNAIIAKDPPSRREDPDWDAEDARYSSIRWLPSTTENAMGPHTSDPRSGEILEADIQVYHNVMKLCRDWYFTQVSPNDERARKLPLPDDLLGELLSYVIAHEVGHSLGFPHNMKASSSYTVAQLRDPAFTAKYGTEASIMDYGRFNYVAQPGDGAALIPKIGPYDTFAVEWGYRPFPEARSPEAERPFLAKIVARQRDDSMLLFGDPNPSVDPSQQTEDLGSEPVLATELGLKNLDRILGYLVEATCQEGENYDELRNMYDSVVSQRNRELGHVANVVAGVVRHNFWYGDADAVYEPVSAESQRKAVAFLSEHVFATPLELIDPGILARLEPSGAAERILGGQKRILGQLLSDPRIGRLAELAERGGSNGYTPVELFHDLHHAIFSELEDNPVAIDLYRRGLQRAFTDMMIDDIKTNRADSDLPTLARGELARILGNIQTAAGSDAGEATKEHLHYLEARIQQSLEGRFLPQAETTTTASPFGRRG